MYNNIMQTKLQIMIKAYKYGLISAYTLLEEIENNEFI